MSRSPPQLDSRPYRHPPFYNFDWSGTPLPYVPSDDTRNRESLNLGLLLRHPRTYLGFTPYFRFESLGLGCLIINLNLWLTSRPITILRCRMTSVYQVTPTIMRRYINVSRISYIFTAQPLLFFLGQDII